MATRHIIEKTQRAAGFSRRPAVVYAPEIGRRSILPGDDGRPGYFFLAVVFFLAPPVDFLAAVDFFAVDFFAAVLAMSQLLPKRV
jgi:hypothetical protein